MPEVAIHKEGVKTNHGIFIPLYEVHSIGINEEDIPQDTNIFFKELVSNKFGLDTREIFSLKTQFGQEWLPKKLLAKLSDQKTEIMLGDITVPYIEETLGLEVIEALGGALLLYYGLTS